MGQKVFYEKWVEKYFIKFHFIDSTMEYEDWKYIPEEDEKPALFITSLHLENGRFQYKPTLDEFNDDVSSVIQRFEGKEFKIKYQGPAGRDLEYQMPQF